MRKPKPPPRTISVPQAGRTYYDLGDKASYRAAARGEIPFLLIGRRKRVPVEAMERRFAKIVETA